MATVPTGLTLRGILRGVERAVLGRDATAPIVRFVLVWGSVGLYWITLAVAFGLPASPLPGWLDWLPFPFDTMVETASIFFAPSVLTHLLPVAAGLWLAYRVAVNYLADLFDLEELSTAARYLWPSMFGVDVASFPRLEIATGELEQIDRSHPLAAIGGPGYVKVHLGHAAVFEDLDGRPRVYGPCNMQFIHGFERLRDVIDLRDQVARVDTVQAITRDGIEVRARDAQMVFRVHRGRARERTLENPYPFDPASIRRLVYAQPVGEDGRSRWTESLPDRVRREIRRFVASLSLEEFLALRPLPAATVPPQSFHIPREALTARFHTPEETARLREAGLELDWVGVGTWEVGDRKDGSDLSVGQVLVAGWRDKERIDLYTSPEFLDRQRRRGFREFAATLLLDWLRQWRDQEQTQDPQGRCLQMLAWILDRLSKIAEEAKTDPAIHLPAGFEQSLQHLRSLTAARWVGGGRV